MNAITDRRRFLQGTGLTLGLALPIGRAAAQTAAAPAAGAPFAPNAFVRVTPDNAVVVVIKHVEFGQGPATGLATILADELDADWAQVRVEMAPANDPLYKNLFFQTMGTGGSTSMANSWMQMRNAGASARAMLVEAAAKRWGVAPAQVSVNKGVVTAGTNRATFGDLAAAAGALRPPAQVTLKTPDKFTLIGRDTPKVDSLAKTDGSALFAMDIRRPGMVHSAILHPPAFGGKVRSVDDAAALAVPGVVKVATIPQGVVVYARDTFAAMKGRSALRVEWDLSEAETRSSETMFRTWAQAASTPGTQHEQTGDPAAALAAAAKTIDATFYFPFLAHAPMEPLDAVIEVKDGRGALWMGSQFQFGETATIAGVIGVPVDKMVLHQQYAGGSFGRRAQPTMQFATEAGMVFKAWGRDGAVKHMWSRENDIRGGHYRPLTVHRVRAGLNAANEITAWDQVVATQSFVLGTPMQALAAPTGVDTNMFEGVAPDNYAFANARVGYHVMPGKVPTLWWRSVGHTHTAFASEVLLDELIALAGGDAVEMRLKHLKEARAKAVLSRVAEMARWGRRRGGDRALGIAVHKSFGSFTAQAVEVSRGADGLPRVHKVWAAVDCGQPINPNIIRAQMEGGIGFALGHALYADLVVGEGGRVAQGNFDTYRSLRINEMPEVDVAIIDSRENPTGIGEPGVPATAPAVANAWRRLTGRTVRRLPFIHPDNVGSTGDRA